MTDRIQTLIAGRVEVDRYDWEQEGDPVRLRRVDTFQESTPIFLSDEQARQLRDALTEMLEDGT